VRLAQRVAGRDIDYVMLSSRKVYAPSARPLAEADPTAPQDRYGEHKLAIEQALRARLGERLTILRLANVFGYERGPERRTFLSLLLDGLAAEGRIRLDMSPFVERDFLPVEACARVLARIVAAPPGGVLNVGSGIALPTGRLALWVLEGYGRGELVIESPREHDAFVLDVGRLRSLYGEPTTMAELRESCLQLGRRLASETGQR
jgi:UDP-glucose 4-epimerase